MKNPWILPAAALLVGGAGGFFAGKTGGSGQSDSNQDSLALSASRGSNRGGSSSSEASRSKSSKSLSDIRKTPGQNGRIQALLDYYQNLTPDQLEAEAAKLENLPMNERIMASILLFGRWAETDPKAAMAYSDKMGMGGMFVKPTILQSWASVDPENAAKYYAENPREFQMMGMGMGGRGGSGASVIASEWAKNDPQAAMAWAQSLQGRDKTQATTSVVRELASTDPEKAVSLANGLDGEAQKDAYASIASQWGAKDFNAAETWIKSLPADQQQAALAEAIGSLANSDPQAASQKIASITDEDSKRRAISDTVDAWSRQDPQAAATWLLSQGSEDVSRNAMRDLMRNWSSQDDSAAVAFISKQPAGETRDEAVGTYIWSNRSENPQSVMTLAESITDERARQRAVATAAEQWMRTDPEAAKEYIAQSTTISDEAKQRLQDGGRGGFGANRFGGGGPGGNNNGGGNRRRGN